MTYSYCFDAADGDAYTAEYALDEIQYTSFAGSPAVAASRAVAFVYGTKDPADVRTLYSGGMALQSSLQLEEVQMLGPGEALVRRYDFTYQLGPTTSRTLLSQVEECAGDGVCLPPTRFSYSSSAAGFTRLPTSLPAPTSTLSSPMVFDLDGDGLDDLVLPDTNKALSTPVNPITDWLVMHNQGAGVSPSYFAAPTLGLTEDWPMVANPSGPADPTMIQPELGTAIDYNQDGLTDVFLHDVWNTSVNWQVLLAQPDRTFKLFDTGIAKPFPLGVAPAVPTLTSSGGSAHLADVDGDGVPDLIQCQNFSEMESPDPAEPAWVAHLWKPAQGGTAAGFDGPGEPIMPLMGFACDTPLYTVDINGDGKVDLVVTTMLDYGGTQFVPGSTFSAVTRDGAMTWHAFDTQLPVPANGGSVLFLDVNGDGLPDAVESGQEDGMLWTWLNAGPTFTVTAVHSTGDVPITGMDEYAYFGLATALDYNGDGRQDILMPVLPGTLPNQSGVLPAWAILQATGSTTGPTFTLVDPHIPFEPLLANGTVGLADPHGPRIGDLNGDGAPDVILPLAGVFNVFRNLAPDQDLLVAVSDGMNAHDPTDPGFVPNATVSYGHMTDASITNGTAAGSPALEGDTYLSHADPTNGCAYPMTCAVGSRRLVTAYTTNNGADVPRHHRVRYRDGRYHRLGRGFLGFDERIVTDLDTLAGAADFYDNSTSTTLGTVIAFPLAGQVEHQWRWYPGLASQPNAGQFELSLTDITRTIFPTNDSATYFTLVTNRRSRREEGEYPNGSAPTVETYVQQCAAGNGATLLTDTTMNVSLFDPFGNVQTMDVTTVGVDLTLHTERTFLNDTTRWVLGQLQTQSVCSTAATLSQCRLLTRHTTIYGEVHDETTASDDGIPDTQLALVYARDAFGNVNGITATDAFGHQRVSSRTYDAEGIFPTSIVNAAMQTTFTQYDPRFGKLAKLTDPNRLATTWAYDGFGRLGVETRPDTTQTTVTLARTKDGGPNQNAWLVTQRSTTTGGADDTVAYDSLSRPIQWWWHGPDTGSSPRVMQEIAYDALGEHVAQRSVPASEDTPASALLFDLYAYDALGREVQHTSPWSAVTWSSYGGLNARVDDPLLNTTFFSYDALWRTVAVTDAAHGVTAYGYGPFGDLYTVTAPDLALTRTTRDAFGRVRQLDDPDRGTTTSTHDGFGELVSSSDALGREITFGYDALGRPQTRLDQDGAQSLTTTWTWDTAAHGIGKLAQLTSPDGQKTYGYTSLGQLQTIALAVNNESDLLQATLGYDPAGRVASITYPTPAGAAPFVVAQDYDAYGHVLTVRDSTTDASYWHLTGVDGAGRTTGEAFGNGVSTARSYYADKQSLQSIVTTSGATTVQNLAYDYDARRDLTSRTDALQPQNQTERFRYDPLERLTCAYFGATQDDTAPCALDYAYDPSGNGNLTTKSDVGTLVYGDPQHPHAVTGAGSASFGYDAVGNQIARPGGATVGYTPFDLPSTITQSTGTVTLAYDGDQQRIRKTTPEAETLYLGDLYQRVTTVAPASTAHAYYIHAPERVVAVVTLGGPQAGTLYVHVDHLGSVDALTDASGGVVEHRSYDPFGQRRNPVWGQPVPATFASTTTVGFTGQESDDELGLVNFKGRMYDPAVGRFLTTDPIVGEPWSGQSWNPYSYVVNNPLNYVDPSGFAPDYIDSNGVSIYSKPLEYPPCDGPKCGDPPPKEVKGTREAVQVGAVTRPVDVGTTGSSSAAAPPQATTPPPNWEQHPVVQVEGGFLAGLALGFVPFAGVGHAALDGAKLLPHGTPEARLGLAAGQITAGIFELVGGLTGEVLGGIGSATGIGAAVGVPVMAVSTVVVVGAAREYRRGDRRAVQQWVGATGEGHREGGRAATAGRGGASHRRRERTECGRGEGSASKVWHRHQRPGERRLSPEKQRVLQPRRRRSSFAGTHQGIL